jgi:ABC-type multidrug transport system fused ATPase/permease subunit
VVKAHGRTRSETKQVEKLNRLIVKHGTRLEAAGGWLEGASHTVLASTGALVLLFAASELSAGRLTGGQLVSFFTLLGLLSPVLHRITLANRYLQEAQISIERLTDTLAEAPETDPDEELPKLLVSEGTISVQEASFSYPDGTRVLNGASMVVRRGELVAILGENGSGKSTLLKLLARFLESDSGRVVVDGQDAAQVSARSVRAAVGLVTQEPKLFEGTIRENVAYGARTNMPEAQVERAMRISGINRMAERLPDGLETMLREGKRELSLAERQKISLARTLAVGPPILALDEPCSGLDHRAEAELADTLRGLARNSTVIVATHSTFVLLEADRIYRLEDGRLCEEDLLALYAQEKTR